MHISGALISWHEPTLSLTQAWRPVSCFQWGKCILTCSASWLAYTCTCMYMVHGPHCRRDNQAVVSCLQCGQSAFRHANGWHDPFVSQPGVPSYSVVCITTHCLVHVRAYDAICVATRRGNNARACTPPTGAHAQLQVHPGNNSITGSHTLHGMSINLVVHVCLCV